MLKDVIEAANESMFLEDEKYVLVVDLFILRPELNLQVNTGDSHPSGSILVFVGQLDHLIESGTVFKVAQNTFNNRLSVALGV